MCHHERCVAVGGDTSVSPVANQQPHELLFAKTQGDSTSKTPRRLAVPVLSSHPQCIPSLATKFLWQMSEFPTLEADLLGPWRVPVISDCSFSQPMKRRMLRDQPDVRRCGQFLRRALAVPSHFPGKGQGRVVQTQHSFEA